VNHSELQQAIICLTEGKIIAYPTESVFGLGCDPFNEHAVTQLLGLKRRDKTKGLILIASDWTQINPLVLPLSEEQKARVNDTWEEPTTWLLPASKKAPPWITGNHANIAIRLTQHPIARTLCQLYNKPIVSTSANISGSAPAKTIAEVKDYFDSHLCFILPGELGSLEKPTQIRDFVSGKIIRE
jgi:L-threonylcarbamoyladenylate synthase